VEVESSSFIRCGILQTKALPRDAWSARTDVTVFHSQHHRLNLQRGMALFLTPTPHSLHSTLASQVSHQSYFVAVCFLGSFVVPVPVSATLRHSVDSSNVWQRRIPCHANLVRREISRNLRENLTPRFHSASQKCPLPVSEHGFPNVSARSVRDHTNAWWIPQQQSEAADL